MCCYVLLRGQCRAPGDPVKPIIGLRAAFKAFHGLLTRPSFACVHDTVMSPSAQALIKEAGITEVSFESVFDGESVSLGEIGAAEPKRELEAQLTSSRETGVVGFQGEEFTSPWTGVAGFFNFQRSKGAFKSAGAFMKAFIMGFKQT